MTDIIKDPVGDMFFQTHQYHQACNQILDHHASMDDLQADFLDFYTKSLNNLDNTYLNAICNKRIEKIISESESSLLDVTQSLMDELAEHRSQQSFSLEIENQVKKVKYQQHHSILHQQLATTHATQTENDQIGLSSSKKILVNLQSARSDYKKMLKERHNIETSSDNSILSEHSSFAHSRDSRGNSHNLSEENVPKQADQKKIVSEEEEASAGEEGEQQQQCESPIPSRSNAIIIKTEPEYEYFESQNVQQQSDGNNWSCKGDLNQMTFKKPEMKSKAKEQPQTQGSAHNQESSATYHEQMIIKSTNKKKDTDADEQEEVRKSLILKFEEAVHHSHSKDPLLLASEGSSLFKNGRDLDDIISSLTKSSSRDSGVFFTAKTSFASNHNLRFQNDMMMHIPIKQEDGIEDENENQHVPNESMISYDQPQSNSQQLFNGKQSFGEPNLIFTQQTQEQLKPESYYLYCSSLSPSREDEDEYEDEFSKYFDQREQYDLSNYSDDEDGCGAYIFRERLESLGGSRYNPEQEHSQLFIPGPDMLDDHHEELSQEELAPSENFVATDSAPSSSMFHEYAYFLKQQQHQDQHSHESSFAIESKYKKLGGSPAKKCTKPISRLYCNEKRVPLWASNMGDVERVSRKQKNLMDTTQIFGAFKVENMDLTQVFERNDGRYRRQRGSSAHWKNENDEEFDYNSPSKKREMIRGMQYNLSTTKRAIEFNGFKK